MLRTNVYVQKEKKKFCQNSLSNQMSCTKRKEKILPKFFYQIKCYVQKVKKKFCPNSAVKLYL